MSAVTYRSPMPYPPVNAGEKNTAYALAMLDNVGGSISEMSAVSLYFYDHLVTEDDKNISQIFEEISIAEMHHLEIFGELSLQLGADPRLWTRKNNRMIYWTPQYNKYTRNLTAILTNALNSELAAIAKYEVQAKTIKDQNVVENLQRIIVDEKIHAEVFRSLLKQQP